MKFSWNWMADWVDLSGVEVATVADRFTMTVAELEGVHAVGQGLRDVVAGRILSVEPHPNADKLRVVEADVGGRRVRGVSGAPNVAVGLACPVALPGTVLPGGVEVKAVEIRGVASALVLLSEREMGLSDDHSGVMELDPATVPGTPLPDVLPVEDWVFEVDNKSLTHRPDLWGHHGLAREVAALLDRPLKPLAEAFPEGEGDAIPVTVADAADCPRYMAMAYGGVRILPSPFAVRHRLRAVGLRPINNVVDATNYVMMALGEPVHAFDRRQLEGGRIEVRRARPGEVLRLLDGRELSLAGEDLVIADAVRPVALAGVMGGEHSGILPDTADVVLECATFHPARVRRTALRHAVRTDSSARFEKSLDPRLPPRAVAMFTDLLARLSPGAAPVTRAADVAQFRKEPLHIRLDPAFVSRRLGVEVPAARTRSILQNLGFRLREDGGAFDVEVPSWRATKDVSIPEDLLEEIGRVIGYDNVPPVAPKAAVALVPRQPRREALRVLRGVLASDCGLDEVMTYSFDSQDLLRRLGLTPPDPLAVVNPISADFSHLRTDLSANLLGVLERNAGRYPDAGAFEVGRVFRATLQDDGIPVQPWRLGVVAWRRGAKGRDEAEGLFRKVKGALAHLFDRLDVEDAAMEDDWAGGPRPFLHPGATVAVRLGGVEAGFLGLVHPATMQALDVPGVAALAELDLDLLVGAPRRRRAFQPVPRFPSITADLSLVAPDAVRCGVLAAAVRRGAGPFLASADLVAVYAGAPIPEGHRSLSFRMTFTAPDRTLSDGEVKAAMEAVVAEARTAGATVWGQGA